MNQRICVFSCSCNSEVPDGYILYLMKALKKIAGYLLAAVNKDCPEEAMVRLKALADEVILSDNNAYAAGIEHLCKDHRLDNYDELILADDSFFGPLYSFEALFEQSEKALGDADFWGISCYTASPLEMMACKYNLQAYFMVIRKKMLCSDEFGRFWKDRKNNPNDPKLRNFSQLFSGWGFKQGALFISDSSDTLSMLRNGFPVLMRSETECSCKDILSEKMKSDLPEILEFIRKNTDYDAELIMERVIKASAVLPYEAKRNGYSCGYISDMGQAAVCPDEFADGEKYSDMGYTENDLRSQHSDAKLIKNSPFFNINQYTRKYPESLDYKPSPEYHYLNVGWKKGYDPSDSFSTEIYLQLNDDVRQRGICPLVHFERYGRNERRPYNIINGSIIRPKNNRLLLKRIYAKLKRMLKNAVYSAKYRHIDENKIVFQTFQNDYTCNPKYICEELLRQELPFDLVWIADISGRKDRNFPPAVRTVRAGSGEALKELMTARLIIDNGVLPVFSLRRKQISVNTWHGSMGFKRLDGNQMKNAKKAARLYGRTNNFVISNSTFEDNVFRSSYWKKNEFIKCGHPRNDILISCDEQRAAFIKNKIYSTYHIPEDKKLVLYAPTFREKLVDGSNAVESEDIDLDMLCDALQSKFGGEWCVLMRAHFVNSKIKTSVSAERHRIYNATAYPDIQELMIAADVGVTDYSSWILDFMFTRKPAFLYTPDYGDYDLQRGFYYPLSESPFPAGKNNAELSQVIDEFDSDSYKEKIDLFLRDKGSREDGCGSKTMVEFIKKLMNYKENHQ